MRFTVAWANVISENLALKFIIAALVVVIIALALITIRLSGRKPLIVERACYSRTIPIVDAERTAAEAEAFVREALAMRFDTIAQVKPGYVSFDEEKFRTQEQQELKKRDMSQKIVINAVAVSAQTVTVDSDRVFTVGAVRSVLSFPLVLTLGTVDRSEWNPYGLVLLQISAPQSQDAKTRGGKK